VQNVNEMKKTWMLLSTLGLATAIFLLPQCRSAEKAQPQPVNFEPEKVPYAKLSDYHLFAGDMREQRPNEGVLPYDLNTPLFSDYAHKARFVWVPPGQKASLDENGKVQFPSNSILVKTFYYPADFRKKGQNNLIETRLLFKIGEEWQAFTYVWNEDESEAELSLVGDIQPVSWINEQGQKQKVDYLVPNKNQCKSCHNVEQKIEPIGPKFANLNRRFDYASSSANQLDHWQKMGILSTMDLPQASTMPMWNDPQSGSLQDRALAYLDVNCGHCHSPQGPAHTTGLFLQKDQTDLRKLGLCKPPVAAGKGSGNRKFSIIAGKPDESILLYRMENEDPGVMMPELGRAVVHKEGIALIRAWIKELKAEQCD
jgi:uncharacterized repeat protein (TIGR03806 family)